MKKPKLRWIEAHPYVQDGKEVMLLSDRESIAVHGLVVSREVAFMISLMDGTRSIGDIQTDFMRASGELVHTEKIEELVGALDSYCFLQSEKYLEYHAALKEEYRRLARRPAFLAGKSYAANRMELLSSLDEMFGADGECSPSGEITGIVAPHIDYARGVDVYRKTYRFLKGCQKPIVVILGTCHLPTERIVSISCKDFETPIEAVPVAKDLARLVLDDGLLAQYVDEWPHRTEHSIELQLPLLQFMMQDGFEILPILTGSMHEYVEGARSVDDGEIDEVAGRLKVLLEKCGRPFVVLSGADLAHIGAQFGDAEALDKIFLDRSKRCDERLLESVKKVDAKGFFETIREERDSRRICGLTPIYIQLKLLAGSVCDIVGYDQWTDGKSSVSFTGGVFYKA
jgi:MEMO1 family protein